MTNGKAETRANREKRLQAALRENLKRRKAQDKARRAREGAGDRTGAAHDSAGIGGEKRGD